MRHYGERRIFINQRRTGESYGRHMIRGISLYIFFIKMRVLSLFDWMACGYEALQRAWIPIDVYYASEIDKYAIQIAKKNHPDIIEIWDVCNVKWEDYQDIDLLIWGSPCQWFSVAGKQLAFDDPRSKLFFEFVRLKEEIKPKYFLLENVKMRKERIDIISWYLWVQPIEIDSSLVSAQRRKRLYRTNIPNVSQPKDKWLVIKDILEENVDERYYLSEEKKEKIKYLKWAKTIPREKNWHKYTYREWAIPLYDDIEKPSRTILTSEGNISRTSHYIIQKVGDRDKDNRWVRTDKSYTLPANPMSDRGQMVVETPCGTQIGNSKNFWNSFGSPKAYTLRACNPNWVIESIQPPRIRKLTPIECERLQTLPDNYTEWVSDSQRYKMLGNWWTVDVISHIFSFLPKE